MEQFQQNFGVRNCMNTQINISITYFFCSQFISFCTRPQLWLSHNRSCPATSTANFLSQARHLKNFLQLFYSCYTGVLGQKHIILVADTHMLISSHPDCNVHAQLRSVAISSIMAKIGMNKKYPFKNRICKWEFFCYLDLS